jgi:hypothetical protein
MAGGYNSLSDVSGILPYDVLWIRVSCAGGNSLYPSAYG